jgi:hypothetical protein
MSMAEIERLERQIAALEARKFAERFGISATSNLLLVRGGDTVADAKARRLRGIPPDIVARIKLQPVLLPWLNQRAVAAQTGSEGAQT